MALHKDSTITYALGFVEDYIEKTCVPLEVDEETMTDENLKENEHREHVRAMMKVLSEGVFQLSRENLTLATKISLGKSALS
jgi:hypothetical protein